jgi:hypothetical protein
MPEAQLVYHRIQEPDGNLPVARLLGLLAFLPVHAAFSSIYFPASRRGMRLARGWFSGATPCGCVLIEWCFAGYQVEICRSSLGRQAHIYSAVCRRVTRHDLTCQGEGLHALMP